MIRVRAAVAWYKKKMTEEEFQEKLEKMGLAAEEHVDGVNGRSIRFRHPIAGVIADIGYSQEAIDDLKELHDIDGGAETRAAAIKLLEDSRDVIAIKIIEKGDPDAFFELYNFGHLEELVEKYPRLAKVVANPKWKPK
jgi:hypothetical protein